MPPLSGLSSSIGIIHESFRRDSVSNGGKFTGVTFGKVIVFIVVVFILISFVWVMAWKYRTTRMPERRGSWPPRVQAHAHAKVGSISTKKNNSSSSSTPYDDGRTSPYLWRSESRASIPLPVYTPPPPAYFPRGQQHVSVEEMHDTRSLMGERSLS